MKKMQVKSLGLTYTLTGVPETADEYDKLAGKQGACVEAAVANDIYRGANADFRRNIVSKAVETHKEKRKTKVTGKTKEGKEIVAYDETEQTYLERVAKKVGKDMKALFQPVADKLEIVFSNKPKERSSAPKKVPTDYLATAQDIIKAGVVDKVAAKVSKESGVVLTLPLPKDSDEAIKAVATAVWQNELAKERARKAQRAAEYTSA